MNKRDAVNKGYQFTGSYNRDKEIIVTEIAELKSQGFKVVIVPAKTHGYNSGYSVYAEPKLFLTRQQAQYKKRVDDQESRMEFLLEKHRKEIAELQNTFSEETEKKAELDKKLAEYSF